MTAEKLSEILVELRIDKETRKEFEKSKIIDFFNIFIKNNRFITIKALTGDFLNKLGFNVYKGRNEIVELRRILIYSFRPLVIKAVEDGKIERYNGNCYVVC